MFKFKLNFNSPPILESNYEIYLRLDVDLQTKLNLIEVTIAIGQHQFYTDDLSIARHILYKTARELAKLKKRYKPQVDNAVNVNWLRILEIEIYLNEQQATLEMLVTKQIDYNLIRTHLDLAKNILVENFPNNIAYQQQINIKLKSVEFMENELRVSQQHTNMKLNRSSQRLTKNADRKDVIVAPLQSVVTAKCDELPKRKKRADIQTPETIAEPRRTRRRSPRI